MIVNDLHVHVLVVKDDGFYARHWLINGNHSLERYYQLIFVGFPHIDAKYDNILGIIIPIDLSTAIILWNDIINDDDGFPHLASFDFHEQPSFNDLTGPRFFIITSWKAHRAISKSPDVAPFLDKMIQLPWISRRFFGPIQPEFRPRDKTQQVWWRSNRDTWVGFMSIFLIHGSVMVSVFDL